MSFFEKTILNAISSNYKEPAASLPINSPKSVAAYDHEREKKEDILYQNLSSDSVFSLIEGLKWNEVIATIKLTPDDASQWVKKTDKGGVQVIWRRLPLHEACVRKAAPEVVLRLLEMFPAGAEAKDDKGRTPLHHAFIHNAGINVIYLLVNAYHDALFDQDFWGKSGRDYAMLNNSVYKKDIVDMLHESEEEIASTVQEIECRILKQSSLSQTSDTLQYIKTQPNPVEMFLEEELNQARVESDAAYVQRDAALHAQSNLMERVKFLEKQLVEKEKIKEELDNANSRNKSLNSLLTRYENKNKELEDEIAMHAKHTKEAAANHKKEIDSIKNDFEHKLKEIGKQMKGKEKRWKRKKVEFEKVKDKMKETVTVLSDKLRRMECNDEHTIHTTEVDRSSNEGDEKDKDREQDDGPTTEVDRSSDEVVVKDKDHKQDDGELMEKRLIEELNVKQSEIDHLNDLVAIYKPQISTLEIQVQECKKKVASDNVELTELKKELEIYKSRHDGAKERISSLENLITVYKDGSAELEEDLQRTELSLLQVTDQLADMTDEVSALEQELCHMAETEQTIEDYRMYSPQRVYSPRRAYSSHSRVYSPPSSRAHSPRSSRTYSPHRVYTPQAHSEIITPRDYYRNAISRLPSFRARSSSPVVRNGRSSAPSNSFVRSSSKSFIGSSEFPSIPSVKRTRSTRSRSPLTRMRT